MEEEWQCTYDAAKYSRLLTVYVVPIYILAPRLYLFAMLPRHHIDSTSCVNFSHRSMSHASEQSSDHYITTHSLTSRPAMVVVKHLIQ
jgi:hypothetical protein